MSERKRGDAITIAEKSEAGLQNRGRQWKPNFIDGCRFDLRGYKDGLLLKKPWKIMSTDLEFRKEWSFRVCTGDHEHGVAMAGNAEATSYYPPKMVRSLWHTWARQLRGAPLEAKNIYMDLRAVTEMPPPDGDTGEPAEEAKEQMRAWLHKLHRATGHPRNAGLARTLKDAGKPAWVVERRT